MERRWFEPGTEYLDRPICDAVGGVVGQMLDYLPADAGVSAALDLDDGRDDGLVEEEVVDRPSPPTALLGGERHLARVSAANGAVLRRSVYRHPPSFRIGPRQASKEFGRVTAQEPLGPLD